MGFCQFFNVPPPGRHGFWFNPDHLSRPDSVELFSSLRSFRKVKRPKRFWWQHAHRNIMELIQLEYVVMISKSSHFTVELSLPPLCSFPTNFSNTPLSLIFKVLWWGSIEDFFVHIHQYIRTQFLNLDWPQGLKAGMYIPIHECLHLY